MALPDEHEVKKALDALMSLSRSAFDARVKNEIGDPLLAFFAVLARRFFPEEGDTNIDRKVNLLMIGYFLREDLRSKK
jgi:hypothetical protein